MTISQRSDDLADETNEDLQYFHPPQMIPPTFYYPPGPGSSGGHVSIAAAPMVSTFFIFIIFIPWF